jgi:uncharacterized protein
MIQPVEMKLHLPMKVANDVVSTTIKVWDILTASYKGDLVTVKTMIDECPELIYAQYNYTPPIHFAVREGHTDLVKFLLNNGALDPTYRTYPFLENLLTVAQEREHNEIAQLLEDYYKHPEACKFKGDNGEILYNRSETAQAFQEAVNKADIPRVQKILEEHPGYALDDTFFWGEGVLLFPAKENNRELMELLMSYGAKVPKILKWAQFYYFERYDSAVFLMEKGMDANTMSWHHVTLLHDMAQKGELQKARLLIEHGADINAVDEEYQSTPLGMAVRWGHKDMVAYLLQQGADPNKSGAAWSAPLAWAKKKGFSDIESTLQQAINKIG